MAANSSLVAASKRNTVGPVFSKSDPISNAGSFRATKSPFCATVSKATGDYYRWRREYGEDVENIGIMLIPKLRQIFPDRYSSSGVDYFSTEQFMENLSRFLYRNS